MKICGCLTADTNSTLYAFDDNTYACWMPANAPYYNYTNTDALVGYVPGQVVTGHGKLWMYTDCLAKKGPVTKGPDLVGCDPVSGRNQEINLSWEQICLANSYDIMVSKDWPPSLVVYLEFNHFFPGPSALSPAFFFAPDWTGPNGEKFECGHTYYWTVRASGSAMEPYKILSPWAAPKTFQLKAGLPVTTPYIGPLLLAPANAASGIPVKPVSFSWSSYKDTTEYQFQLAEDAAMTKILADAKVPTTAYTYDAGLKYSTNYYWRVCATKPAPSDWSPVFSFLTEAAPPPPPPPEVPAPPPPTPAWVWAIIGIGALLVIVTLILIVRTRRA